MGLGKISSWKILGKGIPGAGVVSISFKNHCTFNTCFTCFVFQAERHEMVVTGTGRSREHLASVRMQRR